MTVSRYSHDYPCSIDGHQFRIAVRRDDGEREIHIEDAARMHALFAADEDFAVKHWLLVFLLPPAAAWIEAPAP